jgi:hypothetical protein
VSFRRHASEKIQTARRKLTIEQDQTFPALDEACRERVLFLWQVRALPEYDDLRADPPYEALLRRMNLEP